MMANLLSTNVVVSILVSAYRQQHRADAPIVHYYFILHYAYKLHTTNTKPKMVPYLAIAHTQ